LKPTKINLHQISRVLELSFEDGLNFKFTAEFLRVHSPSAEVKGHGPGQETLQLDKHDVNISNIEPIGHYAIKIHFDDGHDTGLFSWTYLHDLGQNYENKWQHYLDRLNEAGHKHPSLS
jgi:DUF971 family protein